MLEIYGDPLDDPAHKITIEVPDDMPPGDFTEAHRALVREALEGVWFTPEETIPAAGEFTVRRTDTAFI